MPVRGQSAKCESLEDGHSELKPLLENFYVSRRPLDELELGLDIGPPYM